ncbi:hypothetical protein QOZ80_2AG0098610 [Eleusine coracana subsp. coracana]|nr:hypothetical protein QOZ80_2AG0098610 [Eleusine coracana subsp. coracana]
MSLLTCNLVPRLAVADANDYDYDQQQQQPQTATCCTTLQPSDGRYGPLRTAAAAALLHQEEELEDEDDNKLQPTPNNSKKNQKLRVVRKCKSTMTGSSPCLRRSGAVRRDWSFENLRAHNNNA